MKKIILFLLIVLPFFSSATNRTVSGAGFSVTSMGVLTNGDTLFIDGSSTSNFGYSVLKGLHDVTIMNINGPLLSTTQWDWGNLVRCKFNFSTNGAIQLAGDPTNKYYGLIFQNGTNNNYGMIQVVDTIQFCTFMNIAVIDCTTGLGSPQQANITFDNANKIHKKLLGNTFTNLFQRNTPGAIFPSGGTVYNSNVADSNTYSYSVYDSLTTQNVMAGGYHAFIHHNQFIVVGVMVDSLDHGLLEPLMGFNIHDNLLIGNYRGWFTRLGPGNGHGLEAFGSGKNDSYWWNNIRIGSYDPYQRYGGLDVRIDTPNATYTHGGNVWVYNNSLGNMRESPIGNWFTSVCLSYGMQGPASAGFTYAIHYYNNFRFHSENQTSGTTAHSVGFVLSGGNGAANVDSCSSCNVYIEDPIASTYLSDTSYSKPALLTNTSPLRHAGSTTTLVYPGGTGDYSGHTRPESGQTQPSIGAQEYSGPCAGCLIFSRKGKKYFK